MSGDVDLSGVQKKFAEVSNYPAGIPDEYAMGKILDIAGSLDINSTSNMTINAGGGLYLNGGSIGLQIYSGDKQIIFSGSKIANFNSNSGSNYGPSKYGLRLNGGSVSLYGGTDSENEILFGIRNDEMVPNIGSYYDLNSKDIIVKAPNAIDLNTDTGIIKLNG